MHVNGSGTCHGDGCNRRPVSGMSFCSEDHYEELVAERKSRNSYRTGSPAIANDYSAQLKPATNQVIKRAGRPPKMPTSATGDLDNVKLKPTSIDLPPPIVPRVEDVKFEVGTGVDIKNAMWHVVEHLRAQRSRMAEEMLDIDTTISLLEKRIAR